MTTETTLAQVRAYRWRAHQLARPAGSAEDCDVLDFGVQDTGRDGAAWALRNRGCATTPDASLVWTLRAAPHLYRTAQLAEVAVATAPFSEADARKRVLTAAKPLASAGIDALDALRAVAALMTEFAAEPIAKGAMSTALTAALSDPYLRYCEACAATHPYEMLLRLAALHAGLRLQPGTAPPVLERIPGWSADPYAHLADGALPTFDVVRNYLRFYGPASPRQVAAFLECPLADVRAHWPADAVEVSPSLFLLAADLESLHGPPGADGVVRLLGPYDPYLQSRDRETLVPDAARRKTLWTALGRPGAIVRDGHVVGLWRPKAAGRRLSVRFELWDGEPMTPAIEGQARVLAEFRGLEFY